MREDLSGSLADIVLQVMSLKKILILAQTPPPFHGQAVMQSHLVTATWDWCEKKHIRLNFSDSIEQVGLLTFSKLFRLARIVGRVVVERLHKPIDVLFYPPCGPHRIPFLRDVAILLLVRPLSKRLVLQFHAGGFDQLQNLLTGVELWLARMAYANADAAVVLLPSLAAEVQWVTPRRLVVVPNGIEDQLGNIQRPSEKSTPVILYVGSVSERKGVLDAIEACGMLREQDVHYIFRIVGSFVSTEMRSRALERVRQLKLEDRIVFAGEKRGEEKWEEYRSADVFCFPSRDTENFPVVLLEAMQCKLPIVATRWRAIPELVRDGENGLLVPVEDPRALADALSQLLASAPLRARLGETGREHYLKSYTLSHHLQSLQNVLYDLAFAERN